jgi:serine/threonine protein kinase/tetratricopeptide (TPR) repeat protein
MDRPLPIALPARFELDREIGRGGMAVVYRAHDNHLDRFVAIKVLSADVSGGLPAERFRREIALMAKLVHPGIVALFDSGQCDGRLFYVMPLVGGETLRARLTRERRLAPQDAAGLGADVAEALAYAHGMAIVHRDVKPENVFVVDGRALLADFGIARIAGGALTGRGELTTGGMVLGTLSYMSPEQAGGEPGIDGRSDLYSLGCMLYELLTGAPPFVAPTALGLLGKHMTEAPRPPSDCGIALPADLEAVILQMLAKAPGDRPASAGEVARRLRASSHPGTLTELPRTASAVTETVTIGLIDSPDDDPDCRSVALAVGRAVASSLSAVPGVRVRVDRPEGRETEVRQAASASGPTTVLEGSVRRSHSRMRITLRATRADGSMCWSHQADGTLDEVFALEDAVSASVGRHFSRGVVAPPVRPSSGPVGAAPAGSRPAPARAETSEANHLVAEGVRAFNQFGASGGAASRGHLDEARAYLTRALALDPTNARALCAMGNLLSVEGGYGIGPREESLKRGRELIYAALAADDHCAEVHCSMGKVALYHDDDFQAAARHIRRAVELDPSDPEALRLLSIVYKILGRVDDAVHAARAATARAPDAAPFWNALGDSLLAAGRNAEAVDVLKRAIGLLPGYGPALERLERARAALGEFDLALEIRSSRTRLAGQRERADLLDTEAGTLGAVEAIRRDLRRELDGLLRQAETSDPFLDNVRRNVADRIASGHAELGEWREAMDWVERAYNRRPGRLRRMLTDMPVDYRGLAVDPRYARLLRVAGLEDLI